MVSVLSGYFCSFCSSEATLPAVRLGVVCKSTQRLIETLSACTFPIELSLIRSPLLHKGSAASKFVLE